MCVCVGVVVVLGVWARTCRATHQRYKTCRQRVKCSAAAAAATATAAVVPAMEFSCDLRRLDVSVHVRPHVEGCAAMCQCTIDGGHHESVPGQDVTEDSVAVGHAAQVGEHCSRSCDSLAEVQVLQEDRGGAEHVRAGGGAAVVVVGLPSAEAVSCRAIEETGCQD